MEQWNHYGQQWLDANPQLAVQPASQPADPFAALQPNPVQDVAVNTQPVETYAAQPAQANQFCSIKPQMNSQALNLQTNSHYLTKPATSKPGQ